MVKSHFLFEIHTWNLYWGLQAWHTLHQRWSAWNFSMQYLCNQSFTNKTVYANTLYYSIVTQRCASLFAEPPHIAVATAMVKIAVSCSSCFFFFFFHLWTSFVQQLFCCHQIAALSFVCSPTNMVFLSQFALFG